MAVAPERRIPTLPEPPSPARRLLGRQRDIALVQRERQPMSAFGGKADIGWRRFNVR
jgi:hypothetical protein